MDPLEVYPREVERLAIDGQRDVHDRDVEDRHEETPSRDGEDAPSMWMRWHLGSLG
jgi:hypothetical protein